MTTTSTGNRIGIVVPTLGNRDDYILDCLLSIKSVENCFVIVVAPVAAINHLGTVDGFVDKWVEDPGLGAASAINAGVRHLPSDIEVVAWIGDDDRLISPGFNLAAKLLVSNSKNVAVFGMCEYIDSLGRNLFTNKSGNWAKFLLRFGPNLLPQPGSLIRRSAWVEVGGLDEDLRWTFDLDIFMKLMKIGRVEYVKHPVAQFRWHEGSLTAGTREGSVREASAVRKSFLPAVLKRICNVWEVPMQMLILRAGSRVSRMKAN